RLVPAEHPGFDGLVVSPRSRQERGRIGVSSLAHRSMGDSVRGDDVIPVDPDLLAVDPLPTFRDGTFVNLATGAVRLLAARCPHGLGCYHCWSQKDEDRRDQDPLLHAISQGWGVYSG